MGCSRASERRTSRQVDQTVRNRNHTCSSRRGDSDWLKRVRLGSQLNDVTGLHTLCYIPGTSLSSIPSRWQVAAYTTPRKVCLPLQVVCRLKGDAALAAKEGSSSTHPLFATGVSFTGMCLFYRVTLPLSVSLGILSQMG